MLFTRTLAFIIKYIKLSNNRFPILPMLFIFMIAIAFMFTNDYLKPTREELKLFYAESFDNLRITEIVEREYPGKGYYNLIRVDTKTDLFPIILEAHKSGHDLFKVNSIIFKETNSLDVVLKNKSNTYNIKIRDPKDEDDKFFRLYLPIVLESMIFLFFAFYIFMLVKKRI